MILCLPIKNCEKRNSWLWHLSFQVTVAHTEALLSRKWMDMPMGSNEQHHLFALLVHVVFAFPIKLSLS